MKNKKSFWNDRTVFVTGAGGLLGPWLIEDLLQKGARVIVLIRDLIPDSLFFLNDFQKKTTVVFGDLLDFHVLQRILNEFEVETVFHLGAQAIVGTANRSPLSTFKSNIEGTWNLLEACRLSPWVKRVVVASSDKAYGIHEKLPYKENAALAGRYPYDVSKSCTDLIAQSYFHTYQLPVCVTRCGNFFGGGDLHFNRIIPGTIKSILNNERPIIRSNGLLVRDYIYVKDVVDAYCLLAEKMNNSAIVGQAFNFSTDKPYSVIEIVDEVLNVAGFKDIKPIILDNVENEIPNQHLCSEKAQKILNWEPQYGVKEGLRETFDWYKILFQKTKKN